MKASALNAVPPRKALGPCTEARPGARAGQSCLGRPLPRARLEQNDQASRPHLR